MHEFEKVFIGLGANLEDAPARLKEAIVRISELDGVEFEAASQVYRTNPQGLVEQPWFHNQVLMVEVDVERWTPDALMSCFLGIEKDMGRVREIPGGPRCIDIDMLLFGDRVTASEILRVPHPMMRIRAFVLVPLYELAPDLLFPDDAARLKDVIRSIDYALNGTEILQKNERQSSE